MEILFIRHAESANNEIFFKARLKYPDDDDALIAEVEKLRVANPGLSTKGKIQCEQLATYLVKKLSSRKCLFVSSPMKRALLSIYPTCEQLKISSEDFLCYG